MTGEIGVFVGVNSAAGSVRLPGTVRDNACVKTPLRGGTQKLDLTQKEMTKVA